MTKSGRKIHCDISVSKVDIDGKVFFTGILRDITNTIKQQYRLELQSNILKDLYDWTSNDSLSIKDKTIAFLNLINGHSNAFCSALSLNFSEKHLFNSNNYICSSTPTENQGDIEDLLARPLGACAERNQIKDQSQLSQLLKQGYPIKQIDGFPIVTNDQWRGTIGLFWKDKTSAQEFLEQEDIINTCFHRFAAYIAPLFGYPQGDLETTYEKFMAAIHPDDKSRVETAITDCIESRVQMQLIKVGTN